MVRAWRKKVRQSDDSPGWYRRSRLVGREFNWLQHRDDIYSPASSASITKILPALALSNGFLQDCVMGSLDIQDAFLQVPQPEPREVRIGDSLFVILKCLPGQRDCSKLWCQWFVGTLQTRMNAIVCPEQPCILKVPGCGLLVLHVDDIMFMGSEQWVTDTLIPELKKDFKLSHHYVPRKTGGTFDFLKRTHLVEPDYASVTVYPKSKHVNTLVDRFSKADGRMPKLFKSPCVASSSFEKKNSSLLPESLASEYRSLVGIVMYLGQQRMDIQFCCKILASDLKNPYWSSWDCLRRLVGYLRWSQDFAVNMPSTFKGCTFMEHLHGGSSEERKPNIVEVFSDSDWSGSADYKSTSSAVHCLNGIVVYTTCRGQKCISLSSTEAEWYAASASTCDAFLIQHVVDFVTERDIGTLTLHVDNSAVRMLSLKLGAGRLRHIHGRYLWLQSKVQEETLVIKQVNTIHNIADLNRTPNHLPKTVS